MRLLYPIDVKDQDPDSIAFRVCGEPEVVTYGQLEQRANQAAHVFRACGARLGDHVAILLKNQREFLEICFGAERAGLYYTTMSTRLTVAEIAYIVQDCGAKVLIVGEDLLENMHLWPQIEILLPNIELAVGLRINHSKQSAQKLIAALPAQPKKSFFIKSVHAPVSSMHIRDNLIANKNSKDIVESVAKYAKEQWLYHDITKSKP